MTMGRPSGTARPTKVTDAPILHDDPGRADKRKPGHCDSCSVPVKTEQLLTFRLWSVQHAKWAGEWTLCSRCWSWRNDRPDPDPRHVEEEAA